MVNKKSFTELVFLVDEKSLGIFCKMYFFLFLFLKFVLNLFSHKLLRLKISLENFHFLVLSFYFFNTKTNVHIIVLMVYKDVHCFYNQPCETFYEY
jgi:hypothetical protein